MSEVHKGRFGYHPCSYETFCKLRFLNGLYQQSLRRRATWNRWNRKAPHNRFHRLKVRDESGRVVGYEFDPDGKRYLKIAVLEPTVCPIFNEITEKLSHYDAHGSYHGQKIPVKCVEVLSHKIPEARKIAGRPVATPEEVQQLPISVEEINSLYEQAKLVYA